MGRNPTNGPYHWGNGPKPTRKAKKAGRASSGCAVLTLALSGGMLAAAWSAYETVKAVLN